MSSQRDVLQPDEKIEKVNAVLTAAKPIVLVRYLDHLLFRNCSSKDMGLCVRETVGWLVEETPSTLKVLWDRSVGKLPHERESVESGLVILKSAVLEVRRLKGLEK